MEQFKMKKIIFIIVLLFLFSFSASIFSQISNETKNSIPPYSQNTYSDIIVPDGLSLENVIEIAVKNNLEIRAAKNKFDAKKSTFLQEISPESPEYFFENEGVPKLSNISKPYDERHIGISQTFDFPLKWYYKGKASRQEIKSAEMDYFMAKLMLIDKVREGYYRVLMRGKVNEYEGENLKLLKDFLNKAELKYKLGESPQIEVLKARVEVSKGETNRLIAENKLELAKANLNFLLNWDMKKPIELTDELGYNPINYDLDELKELALKKHPDIMSVEYLYSSMKTRRSLAWSGFLPDLRVGFFRMSYGDPLESKKWGSAIGFNLPVWFFFKQTGEIKKSNAELNESLSRLNNVKNLVLLNVDRVYRELKAFEKSVLMYEESILKESEEMYRIASVSYAEGQIGYIELLEAQRTLTGTRKDYVGVLYDYKVALSALIKEVGGELPEK
jgi:outer membrane protein TolC